MSDKLFGIDVSLSISDIEKTDEQKVSMKKSGKIQVSEKTDKQKEEQALKDEIVFPEPVSTEIRHGLNNYSVSSEKDNRSFE